MGGRVMRSIVIAVVQTLCPWYFGIPPPLWPVQYRTESRASVLVDAPEPDTTHCLKARGIGPRRPYLHALCNVNRWVTQAAGDMDEGLFPGLNPFLLPVDFVNLKGYYWSVANFAFRITYL